MMIARAGGETGWENKKKRVGTSRRGKPRVALRSARRGEPASAPRTSDPAKK